MRVDPELVEILTELQSWQLPEPRWAYVDQVLVSLEAAVAAGDEAATALLRGDLESSGPTRTRIGAPQKVPPPPPVRERANRLVHALSRPDGPESPELRRDGSG